MTYIVKERIGLPVWEDDFVTGIKHFMPGSTITDSDFEEARQDEDETAMLIAYNTWTGEQAEAKSRLDAVVAELEPIQRQASQLLKIDYQKLEMAVADEDAEAYAILQEQIGDLQNEQRSLEEVLKNDRA